MRKVKRELLKAVSICLVIGCTSPIDLELENRTGAIAIYGQVSTQARRNYVTVGSSAGLGRVPFPIEDASVEVVDENGNVTLFNSMEKPGVYVHHGFAAVAGVAYHLRVGLHTGQTIVSEPDVVPVEVGMDSVSYDLSSEPLTDRDGQVSNLNWVNVWAKPKPPTSGRLLYLRWSVDEIYIIHPTDFPDISGSIPPPCYITQPADPQRVTLRDESGAAMSPMLVAKRHVDKSFHVRHYFLTYQSSLSPEAYEYWRKVYLLANQVGTIFDIPGAQLPGNLSIVNDNKTEVLGYFNAMNESMEKFFLVQGDFPQPFLTYCEFSGERAYTTYPRECLDCLLAPNSSYTEPPEWD
jgi:hypothetical protein